MISYNPGRLVYLVCHAKATAVLKSRRPPDHHRPKNHLQQQELLTGFGRNGIGGPVGKQWVATKIVRIDDKPVCWCVPVEGKAGTEVEITLNGKNMVDLRTAHDSAMREPVSSSVKNWWQLAIDLDMPSLAPQVIQYAIFDKDPVPAFIAQVKRMQGPNRQQLEQAGSDAKKEELRAVQMKVGWDFGFKQVTADQLYLLNKRPGSFGANLFSSSAPPGKKWIVTKTVDVTGKPVCWCIPVEVKAGEAIDVTFGKKNTFDLRAAYDKVMRADAGDNK